MKNAFFYFLVFPFYGLLQAIRHYQLSWAKDMLWLFVVFYGYTMSRPEGMDSSRYVSKLERLYEAPRTWDVFVASFYTVDERGQGSVDIYEPLVVNFVSLFTNNGNILYAFYGLVYGFFFSRNLWFVIEEIKKNNDVSKVKWILFFSFICVIGFWELNGVRMWTAAQVFFYGIFMVLYKNKKSGYLFVASSALFHFALGLPILLFLFLRFFTPSKKIIYLLFLLSFFVSILNISSISTLVQSVIPEFFMPRINNYLGEEYLQTFESTQDVANWYVKFHKVVLNYLIAILISVIHFSKNIQIKKDASFYKLYSVCLLLMIFGNILSTLPSGGRFLLIAQYLTTALLTIYFVRFSDKKFKRSVLLLSPVFLFFIVISVRVSFDTISIMTLFTNPILATLFDSPVPLIDLIK